MAPQDPDISKVLLVDDDQVARMLVRRALRDITVDLVEVPDGPTALRSQRDNSFALAIIDIHLVGMDGFDLVRELREQDKGVPVIFLTSVIRDQKLVEQGYELGAVDFLEKSVPHALLATKVSVFVDIDQRQRHLLQQQMAQQKIAEEQASKQATLEALQKTLDRYRAMGSDGSNTAVTQAITGSGPIRERAKSDYQVLIRDYSALYDDYLEQLVVSADKPIDEMRRVVRRIGILGGGPRDLLDIHVSALEHLVQGVNPRRADAYSVEGRLLALEMMGLLTDFYRTGPILSRRPQAKEA